MLQLSTLFNLDRHLQTAVRLQAERSAALAEWRQLGGMKTRRRRFWRLFALV